MTETQIHQLASFRLIVLRVIESFVHKSLDETISLNKMTEVVNTNPLVGLVRKQMKETTPEVDAMAKVTIRDVILSITKLFLPTEIQILGEDSPYFRIKLNREQFKQLIAKVYKEYRDKIVEEIRSDESEYKKKLEEITLIEKGEMDHIIIGEFAPQPPPPPPPTTQPTVPLLNTLEEGKKEEKKKIPIINPKPPTSPKKAVKESPKKAIAQSPKKVEAEEESVVTDLPTKAKPEEEKEEEKSEAETKIEAKKDEKREQTAETATTNGGSESSSDSEAGSSSEEEDAKESEPKKEDKMDVDEDKEDEQTEAERSDTAKSEDSKKRPLTEEKESTEEAEEDVQPMKKKAKPATAPNKRFQLMAIPLLERMASYKYASTFLTPVKHTAAPNYYSLIKQPRDLKTLKQMVKDGRIQNDKEFERDILLMFANAVMYNKTDSDIYNWAQDMQREADKMIEFFRDANDLK